MIWDVKLATMLNLEVIKLTPLKIHKCTDADLKEFYPVSLNQQKFYKKITEAKSLYCID